MLQFFFHSYVSISKNVFVVCVQVDKLEYVFLKFFLLLLLPILCKLLRVFIQNLLFPQIYLNPQLFNHFFVYFNDGIENRAIGEIAIVHDLLLHSVMEFVFFRFEPLNLFCV